MYRKISLIITASIIIVTTLCLSFYNKNPQPLPGSRVMGMDRAPGYDRTQLPSWDRENSYLNSVLYNIEGTGPEIYNKYSPGYTYKNKEDRVYKILIYGDSFLWGNGTTDIYSSMGPRIQDTIDNFTQSGKFKIYYYGKNGDSTFNYADRYGKDFVDKLKPDLIIYNFLFNDVYPNFNEKLICGDKKLCYNDTQYNAPTYLACMTGNGNSTYTHFIHKIIYPLFKNAANKLQTRNCNKYIPNQDNLNPEYVALHPDKSPWLKQWYQALEQLDTAYKDIPHAFLYQYFRDDIPAQSIDFEVNTLKKYNFNEIPMERSKTYLREVANKVSGYDSSVNPENGHPSSGMAQFYAEDIAIYLIKYFNIKNSSLKYQNNFQYLDPNNIISYTLPYKSDIIKKSDTEYSVVFSKQPDQVSSTTVGGLNVSPQTTPCTDLGYPHANIILNRYLNLKKLAISLPQSVKFGYYYYDDEHFMHYKELGIKKGDFTLDLPFNYGVILTLGNTGVNCDISHRVDLPEYQITIKR